MRTAFNTLEASAPLQGAMAQVQAEHGLTMPVVDQGRFVGLLTPENVGEFFMIRSALGNRPPPNLRVSPVIGAPPVIADLCSSRGNAT